MTKTRTTGSHEARRRPRGRRGFTLVELMMVVAIIGVLAALAVFGVGRYLSVAKTAEAKEAVGAIARGAVTSFQFEINESEVLPEGGDSSAGKKFVCASANPVPLTAAAVKGRKYQPSSAPGTDFEIGTSTVGWQCLRYSKSEPMAYRYAYSANSGYVSPGLGGPDPGPNGFEAVVQGDLDADDALATFAITGTLTVGGELLTSSSIFISDELE